MAEHRTLTLGFFADDDVVALSHLAFRVLVTLRGVLPATGLGDIHQWEMCARCRCSPTELEEALTDLEQSKPSGEPGWIVRNGRTVWIRHALRHSRIDPARDRNGRLYVQRLVASARPGPVKDQFIAYYPEFVGAGTRDASVDESPVVREEEGVGRGSGGGPEGVSTPSDYTVDGRQTDSVKSGEPVARARTGDPPEEDPPPSAPLSLRDTFLARYYGGASSARQADVVRQLDAVGTPAGVVLSRGSPPVTATAETLDRALAACLAPGAVRVPDRAIVVLLRKLQQGACNERPPVQRALDPPPSSSRPPSRRRPADGGAPSAVSEVIASVERQQQVARAVAWVDEHPPERAAIEAEVDAQMDRVHPRWRTVGWLVGVRARNIEEAVTAAYVRHAGLPASPHPEPESVAC